MKILCTHTNDEGDILALSFECETWEQAEYQCERHGLALQGAAEEADDG